MMKIVAFLSCSISDELHYLKKPWRNLETFESSSKQRLVKQFVYFARKDKEKWIYSMRIHSARQKIVDTVTLKDSK